MQLIQMLSKSNIVSHFFMAKKTLIGADEKLFFMTKSIMSELIWRIRPQALSHMWLGGKWTIQSRRQGKLELKVFMKAKKLYYSSKESFPSSSPYYYSFSWPSQDNRSNLARAFFQAANWLIWPIKSSTKRVSNFKLWGGGVGSKTSLAGV